MFDELERDSGGRFAPKVGSNPDLSVTSALGGGATASDVAANAHDAGSALKRRRALLYKMTEAEAVKRSSEWHPSLGMQAGTPRARDGYLAADYRHVEAEHELEAAARLLSKVTPLSKVIANVNTFRQKRKMARLKKVAQAHPELLELRAATQPVLEARAEALDARASEYMQGAGHHVGDKFDAWKADWYPDSAIDELPLSPEEKRAVRDMRDNRPDRHREAYLAQNPDEWKLPPDTL